MIHFIRLSTVSPTAPPPASMVHDWVAGAIDLEPDMPTAAAADWSQHNSWRRHNDTTMVWFSLMFLTPPLVN